MKKITVNVVDDHKLIREMWRELFSNNPEITVTGESGDFDEAIEMIKNLRPDIVLLDINLSQSSGFDAVPLIRKFAPAAKIIAVSMHCQPAYAKKMFQLGARGYVTKNSSREEIIKAVDEVLNGNKYLCSEIKEAVANKIWDETEAPAPKGLSIRELEILKLLKDGLSSKQIAAELHLSPRTIEVHRHNILKKLNLKNTAALINFVNSSGFSF